MCFPLAVLLYTMRMQKTLLGLPYILHQMNACLRSDRNVRAQVNKDEILPATTLENGTSDCYGSIFNFAYWTGMVFTAFEV